VNLEGGVGAPDFERFVRGYIKNLDRPYFVLQGHPVMWDDHRFEQFTKIIDFLVEQKARFVLPSEYVAELREERE
jgi:peptidoglycan/xylan/chitin deacetylase (PgdA/CDA1 family)